MAYEEVILDHWRNPRNKGRLKNPDVDVTEANPLCGDVVRLQLKFAGEKVADVRFDGQGCAISQAAASLLTEMIKGRTLDDLRTMKDDELLDALGGVIKTRLSCALLPLRALRKGISHLNFSPEEKESLFSDVVYRQDGDRKTSSPEEKDSPFSEGQRYSQCRVMKVETEGKLAAMGWEGLKP